MDVMVFCFLTCLKIALVVAALWITLLASILFVTMFIDSLFAAYDVLIKKIRSRLGVNNV